VVEPGPAGGGRKCSKRWYGNLQVQFEVLVVAGVAEVAVTGRPSVLEFLCARVRRQPPAFPGPAAGRQAGPGKSMRRQKPIC